ncbi:MAG: hypothetical protein ACJASQ_004302 [Crocinitomicaceae bacterium]|jgi:hypothetical protein
MNTERKKNKPKAHIQNKASDTEQFKPNVLQMAQRTKENGPSSENHDQVQMKKNFFGEPSFNQPNSTVRSRLNVSASEKNNNENESKGKSSNSIESDLAKSKGKGFAMDDRTRASMEENIGSDFSNVRIHTDAQAIKMCEQLGAQAFTNGNDIYFNQGKYNPSTKSGKHLLAHELTHTVQQKGK